MRTLEEIEDNLNSLQLEYINEEDDVKQMAIERKFCHGLDHATEIDGRLRLADGVTINNWTRETNPTRLDL